MTAKPVFVIVCDAEHYAKILRGVLLTAFSEQLKLVEIVDPRTCPEGMTLLAYLQRELEQIAEQNPGSHLLMIFDMEGDSAPDEIRAATQWLASDDCMQNLCFRRFSPKDKMPSGKPRRGGKSRCREGCERRKRLCEPISRALRVVDLAVRRVMEFAPSPERGLLEEAEPNA